VRDALERRLRWLFGAAAAAFASLAGFVAVALAGGAGTLLVVPPEGLPWAAFAVSFAVMATALAVRVARAPRRETFSMAVLAAGLVGSGAGLLAARLGHAGEEPLARVLAAGAAIDLAAAGAFLAAWLSLWFARIPGEVRERRDDRLLVALLESIVPPGGAAEIGASDARLRQEILRRQSARAGEVRIRLELRLLDLAHRVLARESFAHASPDRRSDVLGRLCGSRLGPLRRLVVDWRDLVLAAYYTDERVLDAVGFDRAYLERRLLEGPNREAHRERLARAPDGPTSPAESDLRPAPPDEATVPFLRLIRTGGPATT
jgi:hypothetical protein